MTTDDTPDRGEIPIETWRTIVATALADGGYIDIEGHAGEAWLRGEIDDLPFWKEQIEDAADQIAAAYRKVLG